MNQKSNLQLTSRPSLPEETVEQEGIKKIPKTEEQPSEPTAQKPLTMEERMARLEAMLLEKESNDKASHGYLEALREKEEELKTERAKTLLATLKAQEQEARLLYPKLSLEEEGKDPRFVELLKCGLDVRSAFEVIHKDEIMGAAMEYAAREVERMMTNKLLASGLRPGENGGSHGPVVTKTDVKSMTRQERKDMIRRVRMGEKITL